VFFSLEDEPASVFQIYCFFTPPSLWGMFLVERVVKTLQGIKSSPPSFLLLEKLLGMMPARNKNTIWKTEETFKRMKIHSWDFLLAPVFTFKIKGVFCNHRKG